ncbi:hypothetical protein [Ferroplasma sp.]|uniref:hypothetical protein n=1 Tax=Ferroplasma sp. TaxID=2591003 RepID=UPI00307D324F
MNNVEDWERAAHFIHNGYTFIKIKGESMLTINQAWNGHRDERYANGIALYKRLLKNAIDVIKGWNITSVKNLKEFKKIARMKEKYYLFYLIIFNFVKKNAYSYSDKLNNIYVKNNITYIDYK